MSPDETRTEPVLAEEMTEEVDPKLQFGQRFHNGASWFYWLAGLSMINSLIGFFGGQWGFIFGLGFTQLVDAVVAAFVQESPDARMAVGIAGLAVNLLIAGFFVLMGWLAHQRHQWAFVLGLALYTVDALLFLIVGDWLGLAFHCWVFYALMTGLLACRKLVAMERSESSLTGSVSPT